MKSYKELFPSTFIKAADLGTNRPIGTIERIEEQTVGQGKDQALKPVAYFNEPRLKPLVLNRINAETVAEIAGTDDLECWPGTRVQLFATKTEFAGKRVDCIRICTPPARPVVKPPVPRGRTAAVPVNDADNDVDSPVDDSVGF
jgi:hypothetical protein